MKIEFLNPKKLKPFEKNPKLHTPEQIDTIANSILGVGFTKPVVIDENNTIIIGHGRTLAILQLDSENIPCFRIKGLTLEEKIVLCIADNQITQSTPMDALKYESAMAKLETAGFNMSDLGFVFNSSQAVSGTNVNPQEAPPTSSTIKQMIIIFENERFDRVIQKFELLKKNQPELKDNTAVFLELLNNYETASF